MCGCVPNSGTIVKSLDPTPDIINTVTGVLKGDVGKITQGVGGLVLKSSAPGAAVVAQTIMSSDAKAFAEQIIGRGFILAVSGMPPELIVMDALGNVVDQFVMAPPQSNPMASNGPALQPRGVQNFKMTQATCAVKSQDGSVVVGWVNEPSITNISSNDVKTLMNADLKPNDIITISSDACPFENQGNGSQSEVKNANIVYERPDIRVGSSSGMHWFVIGKYKS